MNSIPGNYRRITQMKSEMNAGVDVSKASLDANWGRSKSFANTGEGIKKLVEQFKEINVKLVVVEATGGYERELVAALCAAEIPVATVNPRRTKAFAKSLGLQAKTDSIDAGTLRLFAERIKPTARKLPPERVQKLQYLLDRRGQLVETSVAEKNRRKAPLGSTETRQSIDRLLKMLKKELKIIEAQVIKMIEVHEDLKLIAKTVQKENGVGPVLTLALLADMPELGTLNRAQVAALTGVAPFDDQSGNDDRSRRIKGGRKRFRQTLYMATVCAVRRNHKLKQFFLALVKRGKKKMIALIATMRKFIIRLNSLVRAVRLENPAIAFAFS
jgi:transposase